MGPAAAHGARSVGGFCWGPSPAPAGSALARSSLQAGLAPHPRERGRRKGQRGGERRGVGDVLGPLKPAEG